MEKKNTLNDQAGKFSWNKKYAFVIVFNVIFVLSMYYYFNQFNA